MKNHSGQRGQALVLVMLALVGLIGLTALAVDGGNAYSDRRHAQNAADTSVMAAGLSRIRTPSCWATGQPTLCSAAENAGLGRALENGYDDNGTSNIVNVYKCTDPLATCSLPAGQLPEYYIQVTITSVVPTLLARIVGITDVTNEVQAVARVVPPSPTPWYSGSALVATMPSCKPSGWPADPFTLSGGASTYVTGAGGVFVNSDCVPAFTTAGGSYMESVAGICVVGGVNNGGTTNPAVPDDYCGTPIDPNIYTLPAVDPSSCPLAAVGQIFDLGGGSYVATPGNYNSEFPSIGGGGTMILQKGIYCLNAGFGLHSDWIMTTDVDGNGTFDGSDGADEGVLLYIPTGDMTLNAGSTLMLGAINKPGTDIGIRGYLIYLPPTNASTITITGNSGSTLVGTILAPSARVKIEGSTETGYQLNLECQIIGYSIEMGGGGTLNLEYNQGQNATTYSMPQLVLYR